MMQTPSATKMFRSNSEKIPFLITQLIFIFRKFAGIDFLCIPNLSEYYKKITTCIYFSRSLKSYKYLKATLLKTFTGIFIVLFITH